MPNIRQTNLIIFLGCCGLMLTAMYMQHVMQLIPCALCITQRLFVVLVGVICLLAFIHNPLNWGYRLYALLALVAAAIGAGFAGRHVWLQNLPDELKPACGPSLEYIVDTFPFYEALEVLLAGDGNCAEVSKLIFGVSIPGWTLVAFVMLGCLCLWQALRKSPAH